MNQTTRRLISACSLALAVALAACGTSPADSPAPAEGAATASLPLPSLHLVYSAAHGLALHGTVPDELERQALLRQARALYGAHRVTDRLSAGPVANPNWLNAAYLPDLRGLHQATVRLADARLEVDGLATSEAAHTALQRALNDIGAHGLQVLSRVAVVAG